MKSQNKWKVIFIILALATAIDLIIPDPLPAIEEILLIAGTLYSSWRSL